MTTSLFITHEIQDFDTWKGAVDDAHAQRDETNVQAFSIHRHLDRPNTVTVYHEFADADAAAHFLAYFEAARDSEDPEIVDIVRRFGIVGDLDVRVADVVT